MIFCRHHPGCNKYFYADRNTNCAEFCEDYNKKYVYLGGAIDRVPHTFSLGWRAKARKILEENGFAVLDPTEGKALADHDIDTINHTKETAKTQIVDPDLAKISKANILLMEISKSDVPYHGTSMELVYGHMWGKINYVWGGCKSSWVIHHSEKVFVTLDEALKHITKGDG